MHKLKKYWEKVSADPVKIEEMEEIVCEALEEVRGRCPRLFWDTAYKPVSYTHLTLPTNSRV